jgi:hypothetical protein
MSWLDRIQNTTLTIITGDGKEYTPIWMEAKKNIKYNVAGFDFIDIEGSYVERKQTSGAQYPMLLYFQGEKHIEILNNFELSANDPRPWTIRHPLYDDLTVQPLGLEIDNSQQNVSKISGVVWETISNIYPQESISAESKIINQKAEIDTQLASNFEAEIQTPSSVYITRTKKMIGFIEKNYSSLSTETSNLFDLVREASGAAQNITAYPLRYIQKTQNLINFPFAIADTIENKILAIRSGLSDLKSIFIRDDSTDDDYIIYEANANTMITQSFVSAINSTVTNYKSRSDVVRTIDALTITYDELIESYDNIGWDQNSDTALMLDNLFNEAIASLYEIAFNAKQERSIILNYDSNAILLAHKYYGPGDDNLNLFIENNNIQLNEMLQINSGRRIVWYV